MITRLIVDVFGDLDGYVAKKRGRIVVVLCRYKITWIPNDGLES